MSAPRASSGRQDAARDEKGLQPEGRGVTVERAGRARVVLSDQVELGGNRVAQVAIPGADGHLGVSLGLGAAEWLAEGGGRHRRRAPEHLFREWGVAWRQKPNRRWREGPLGLWRERGRESIPDLSKET